MSKKHFEAIAKALNRLRDRTPIEQREQVDEAIRVMADVCSEHGANFNRQRFLNACMES